MMASLICYLNVEEEFMKDYHNFLNKYIIFCVVVYNGYLNLSFVIIIILYRLCTSYLYKPISYFCLLN